MKLSELLDHVQEWKWEVLSFELPSCIKDTIIFQGSRLAVGKMS